jgi:membrane fusion protein, multidrug efflux system
MIASIHSGQATACVDGRARPGHKERPISRRIAAPVVIAIAMFVSAPAWPADPPPATPPLAQDTPHEPATNTAGWPDIRVQVVSRTSTTISAPMSGQLDSFPLRDGDSFEKGAVLARFVCDEQQGALEHAKAVLEEKRQILATNHRLRELGTGSGLDYHVAVAQVAEAAADVQTANAVVDNCTVKAPFTGRVGSIAAHDYQYLGVGAPLLDIVEDQALQLELIVPSRWLVWLKPGADFSVTIDETGHTYQAQITRLSGRVDAVSQSIKAYGRMADPSPDLLPGMSGRATFNPPTQ